MLPLERFVPHPDISERYHVIIQAPADLVMDTAQNFDIQSLALVRAIFWLRAKVLRAHESNSRPQTGLVAEMLGLGWTRLAEEHGRLFVAGAACQPWLADVKFSPVVPDAFAAYSQPDQVKIAWTLEAEPLGPAITRFSSETRAVATDAAARDKFRRYWRKFGAGIIMIRRLLLPAVRREAERRWKAAITVP